jgi:lipopolysaccharide export system permease protein
VSLISKYILKAFVRPLGAAVGALILLVMMADLMERLDKFIAAKTPPALVIEYIFALVPLRLVEILPVAALLAVLFAIGSLSRHKEIIASMAGGVHPWRCARPLVWSGFILSIACGLLGEFVNPAAGRRAKEIWNADIRGLTQTRRTRFDSVTATGEGGVLYSIAALDTEQGWMENAVVDIPRDGRPARQIQAARADWKQGLWVFQNGVTRLYDDDGIGLRRVTPFLELEEPLKESPADIVPREDDTSVLGVKALRRHIRRLKFLGLPTRRLEVERHMKLALPWASLIVMLLGIPLAFEKTGGKVKAVASALGVAFLYFGLMQVGRALGQKPWCPPWAGAWTANIVFLTISARLFQRMRRLA